VEVETDIGLEVEVLGTVLEALDTELLDIELL
jgi:hypothetical protein